MSNASAVQPRGIVAADESSARAMKHILAAERHHGASPAEKSLSPVGTPALFAQVKGCYLQLVKIGGRVAWVEHLQGGVEPVPMGDFSHRVGQWLGINVCHQEGVVEGERAPLCAPDHSEYYLQGHIGVPALEPCPTAGRTRSICQSARVCL